MQCRSMSGAQRNFNIHGSLISCNKAMDEREESACLINTCMAVEKKLIGMACAIYRQKNVPRFSVFWDSGKNLFISIFWCCLIKDGRWQMSPGWWVFLFAHRLCLSVVAQIVGIGEVFAPDFPRKVSFTRTNFQIDQCIQVLFGLVVFVPIDWACCRYATIECKAVDPGADAVECISGC